MPGLFGSGNRGSTWDNRRAARVKRYAQNGRVPLRRVVSNSSATAQVNGRQRLAAVWGLPRHFLVEDRQMDAMLEAAIVRTFIGDKAMLQAQQVVTTERSLDERSLLTLADAGPTRARGIIAGLLREEHAGFGNNVRYHTVGNVGYGSVPAALASNGEPGWIPAGALSARRYLEPDKSSGLGPPLRTAMSNAASNAALACSVEGCLLPLKRWPCSTIRSKRNRAT
jgi:hypothetical protein